MHKNEIIQTILHGKNIVPQKEGFAFAPVNFALIKYWGKRNTELNLPMTSSLSIALPEKGAFTRIQCHDRAADEYFLNQIPLLPHDPFSTRATQFLDLFRTQENYHFRVETQMNLPQASGLASSACGFAALTLALDKLFHWQLPQKDLSILARLGSGSACRSLWNGFVEWHAGDQADGMDSYAEPIDLTWNSLCMALLIVNADKKPISSREAMQTTKQSSSYYSAWPTKVATDLFAIKQAIRTKAFEAFGQICESNALAMHATMLTSWPPICYWKPESLEAMQKIWQLRREGLRLYFTQDAGPNLKLIFLAEDLQHVQAAFNKVELVWPFPVKNQTNALVLVDERDHARGTAEKMFTHEKALCHRAFSIFLFRGNAENLELLIQQRHHDKYHCGGLWTNTCCSHPRPGEGLLDAANRRLKEEIGIEVPLFYKGFFHYIASFENHLTENEVDHVFVGHQDPGLLSPDTNEIANLKWVRVETIQQALIDEPHHYTPWFREGLALALRKEL
jgi:diphosphomevalonate decarboxylase